MRTLPILVAALALAASPACSKTDDAAPAPGGATEAAEPPAMTLDQVEHELAAKTVTAVDCNQATTRKVNGILPGAIAVSSLHFAASELPADKAAKLVFYCADSA